MKRSTFLVLLSLIALMIPGSAHAYNSEEHKLIGDRASAELRIPSGLAQAWSRAGIAQRSTDRTYLKGLKQAKMLAVGFDSNDPADYDDHRKRVQDNCYWTRFGQLAYNKKIFIPAARAIPESTLLIPAHVDQQGTNFTLGDLIAIYGDYRKTTYSDQPGRNFLTNAEVETLRFAKGSHPAYCPESVSGTTYLGAIAAGVVPPFGSWGNAFRNTAGLTEFDEAGWWGDEMLRIANINDWHFSDAAIAWYVGLHRLALLEVAKAVAEDDPRYWVGALHYEANALHALTDLFAFGHVVPSRGATSYGIVKDRRLLADPAWVWMQEVIEMGGGSRDGTGRVTLSSALPAVGFSDSAQNHQRNDLLVSDRGSWAARANAERISHDTLNEGGATVRTLGGQEFVVLGDGRLQAGSTSDGLALLKIASSAVTTSVQTLLDAYSKLENDDSASLDAAQRMSVDSGLFAALKNVPVYVVKDPKNYYTGMWASYAKAIDSLTGTGIVPANWAECRVPELSGHSPWPPPRSKPCTDFPAR